MLLIAWSLLWGCEDPHYAVRSRVRPRDPEVIYARGRDAMASAGITRIRWGLTPYVTTTSIEEQYRSTFDLVASRIGIPIDIVVGKSYADVEQQLLAGDIDVATMSPYAYVRAKAADPTIHVFSTHISGGTETYGAYIVATESGPVKTLADTRNRSFAFVDERSSSGWLFPAARMLDANIHPVGGVKGAFYGSHSAVIQAVSAGRAAAGATYDGALAEGRGNIPGAASLRIIARTKRIPFDAYVVRGAFPRYGRDALQEALGSVSTRDSVGRDALAPLMGINGFMPTTDAHYRTVREVEAGVRAALENSGGHLPPMAIPVATASSETTP
jgi:phosphate/phosphite/phosphonate ABC transporter binding protein